MPNLKKNPDILSFSFTTLNTRKMLSFFSYFWSSALLERRLEGTPHGGVMFNHICISSVQFNRSVMSNSLQPHGPQHARPPCPSPTPKVYPSSCPSSWWCHPTISSSVIPFSSCSQSLPASGSFQMSQLSSSGGQSIGISASTSVLPMNIQDWSPLGWMGWTSLQSKGLSKSLLQHHSSKASILRCSAFFIVELSHPYMTTGKTIALTRWTFVNKVMPLLFNMLSRLVITFLPKSMCLLISWLHICITPCKITLKQSEGTLHFFRRYRASRFFPKWLIWLSSFMKYVHFILNSL